MKRTSHKGESNKNFQDSKDKQLQQEIHALETQILDMFEVSFYFAGLDLKYLSKAFEYYIGLLDNEESQEYTAQNIISLIERIRRDKPEWFKIVQK
ncbi:hypothetical protein LS73_002370 [Helicobacter muridarum]|uniref:Uncharacterized protein n=1 Tax=Helicobacter muridarum TaxID=216 RepID=A0A099TW94_9HELI|nr:hypothetical protein [Helicobacter muridarum]TLE01139.1 hypothetical protein LS73_002370 [Helicobacter muridarum]STQ86008.1 Uncharacterised protein [Helicobacter muridarum]